MIAVKSSGRVDEPVEREMHRPERGRMPAPVQPLPALADPHDVHPTGEAERAGDDNAARRDLVIVVADALRHGAVVTGERASCFVGEWVGVAGRRRGSDVDAFLWGTDMRHYLELPAPRALGEEAPAGRGHRREADAEVRHLADLRHLVGKGEVLGVAPKAAAVVEAETAERRLGCDGEGFLPRPKECRAREVHRTHGRARESLGTRPSSRGPSQRCARAHGGRQGERHRPRRVATARRHRRLAARLAPASSSRSGGTCAASQ